MIYFTLFPTWYTVFSSTYNICYPLSSTFFRPHRPIIRRSKLYVQPMVFSPSADVFVVRPLRKNCRLYGFFSECRVWRVWSCLGSGFGFNPKPERRHDQTRHTRHSLKNPVQTTVLSQRAHDKDICRGGEYHRLHVQFRPPDDGPVRPETYRGERIADIVRRRKNSVSSWK